MDKWNKPIRPDELFHFGVKGQKWGVRRYQNSDGTLTSEGRKRMKADNKKAFDLGMAATSWGQAEKHATRRAEKAFAKYEKAKEKGSRSIEKRNLQLQAANRAANNASEYYKATLKEAKAFEKQLIKQYGKENVSSLKYDKEGRVNEKVSTTSEKVGALLLSTGSVSLVAAGIAPIGFIYSPPTKQEIGRGLSNKEYYESLALLKNTNKRG